MKELKDMLERHRTEIKDLRARCPHNERDIKIHEDMSVVGCGSAWPSIHVICRNCGEKKIIFRRDDEELKKKIEKTLKPQGFKDERLNCSFRYDWELD